MIQLKLDAKALENLLKEDDGTIKVELQQSVIEEFGRRHIKAFANNKAFADIVDIAKQETMNEIENMFGVWKGTYSSKKFELNSQIKDMIKLQAKSSVTYELDKVETYVGDIYSKLALDLKTSFDLKVDKLKQDYTDYLESLENEIENMKSKLITSEIDKILRTHIKTIMYETFVLSKD